MSSERMNKPIILSTAGTVTYNMAVNTERPLYKGEIADKEYRVQDPEKPQEQRVLYRTVTPYVRYDDEGRWYFVKLLPNGEVYMWVPYLCLAILTHQE
jgi:hypothetical protein